MAERYSFCHSFLTMLSGKKILVGITGGIAAYKIPNLIRLLVKEGAEVRVVMTKEAEQFVTKKTLSVLSKNKVEEPFFNEEETWSNHVETGLWPDVFIIAPATANTLAKMAHGLCDNFLLAAYLSSRCPILIAPAMDEDMYLHFSTNESLQKLTEHGCIILPPNSGELASGLSGEGRMQEPEEIFDSLNYFIHSAYKGKKILINAGPTYEPIDPVRFIGNRSSGKTGIYLAEAFALMGAEVILVSGPSSKKIKHPSIKTTYVETAKQMYDACMENFHKTDVFIASAAVADFRPAEISTEKIKKKYGDERFSINLVKNPDILAEAGKQKRKDQLLIGYALETEQMIANAKEKIKHKNLDLIVLNTPNQVNEGFGHDTNRVILIDSHNKITNFELMHKRLLAFKIANYIAENILFK